MLTPWHLLKDSAAIYGPSESQQTTGMYTTTWPTAKSGLSSVPCLLQQTSSGDSLAYMRETGRATFRLHLPKTYGGTSVVVNAQDRIGVTVAGEGSAIVYRVVGQAANAGGQSANQIVIVERQET